MPSGETILKITDYPFSYSLIALITTALSIPLSNSPIILLGLAGAFGTFLTFIDPVGIVIRYRASQRILKKPLTENNIKIHKRQYEKSSLNSKSISFEIDKIVALVYFFSLIIIFLFVVWIPNPFFVKLIIKNAEEQPLFGMLWFQIGYTVISIVVLTILGIKGIKFWSSLDEKIIIAGFHQRAIGNEYATIPSLENLTRSIEQNDWEISKIWKEKITEEIESKKGKQELVLKTSELVYGPLYQESKGIQDRIQYTTEERSFTNLHMQTWVEIKNGLKHLMIEKSLLEKIEKFYSLVNKFNILEDQNEKFLKNLILENIKLIFGENVFRIDVSIGSSELDAQVVPLQNCFLSNLLPTKYFRPTDRVISIRTHYVESNSNQNKLYSNQEYIDKFDEFWEKTMGKVFNNNDITVMKELWATIKDLNTELLKTYEEEMSLQY